MKTRSVRVAVALGIGGLALACSGCQSADVGDEATANQDLVAPRTFATNVLQPAIEFSTNLSPVAFTPAGDLLVSTSTRFFVLRGTDASLMVAREMTEAGNPRPVNLYETAGAPNGDIVMVGGYQATPSAARRPWFARVDARGNVLWQAYDPAGRIHHDNELAVDEAGNVVVVSHDTLWRFSANGTLTAHAKLTMAGDSGQLRISSIAPRPSGFVLTGAVDFGGLERNSSDAALLTLDETLSTASAVVLEGAKRDTLSKATPAPDGFYVTGTTWSSTAAGAWLLKLDASLDVVWQKTFDTRPAYPEGSGEDDEGGAGLGLAASDGKIFLVGKGASGILAARLDADGTIETARSFGVPGAMAHTLFPTASGLRMATGRTLTDHQFIATDADLTVPGCSAPEFVGKDVKSTITVGTADVTVRHPVVTLTPVSTTMTPTHVTTIDASQTAGSASICE